MKSFNNHIKSLISLATVPGLTVAIIGTTNSVNALPLDNLNFNTIKQLRQVISQNNEPPEVIIKEPNSSGSTPPPPSTSNSDTRFSCELVNGE
ncbi:MAG: COP23 domain-containing protein, partial [Waterburya sp.]